MDLAFLHALLLVALYCLGKADIPIYDGSWTEWASTGQKVQQEIRLKFND